MSQNKKIYIALDDFDAHWYLEQYPDVKKIGMDPIEHFIEFGSGLGRKPGPGFLQKDILNKVEYCFAPSSLKDAQDEMRLQSEIDMLTDSKLFDSDYYLTFYHDIRQNKIPALWHYCKYGWKEKRNPNPDFNTSYYLEKYKDVSDSGINPLLHWFLHGKNEGRTINKIELDDKIKPLSNNPSIIFLCHEASQTGAPAVILSLMRFIKENTLISFAIIIGQPGPLNSQFEEIAPCFYIHDKVHRDLQQDLIDFCGNFVQVVYVNTIASGHYISLLDFLAAKYITHVHEMENVFRIFEKAFLECKSRCNKFIAVSPKCAEALGSRIDTKSCEVHVLPPFIDPFVPARDPMTPLYDGPVIFGCGTVEKRKGFDLFCEVAQALRLQGLTNFRMYWIGSANGDLDPLAEIRRCKVEGYVEWMGVKLRPQEYFAWGDIFLLPSREDPFPLVGLEAAECGLPVICFDAQAGGMASFVAADAGYSVPYLNVQAMANAVSHLLTNPELGQTLGRTAAQKVKSRHHTDVIGRKILELLPSIIGHRDMTALQIAQAFIDKAMIVSFDIFDTLITRRVDNPSVVFDLIESQLSADEAVPISFFHERMEAAGRALQKHNGEVEDITIDEIYEDNLFYYDVALEKATEKAACLQYNTGLQLYNYAVSQNKTIYITSDMYLDQATIEDILKSNGISNWDALLLSSSIGKKKDTGSLFQTLVDKAKAVGVSPEAVVHFGDNWKGDIYRAREAGLHAVRVTPLPERKHTLFPLTAQSKAKLSHIGRIWDSFCAQAVSLWRESHPQLAKDFFIQLGFELSGPLAAMLAMYARSVADRLGVKKICFLARDGRIIKKAFEALYSREIIDGSYELHYMHLARATVIAASIESPLSSNDLYFLVEGLHFGKKNVRYFLEKAGLCADDPDVAMIVQKYFDSPDVVPDWRDRTTMLRMFIDLSENIYAANQVRRDALRLYLDAHGLLTQEKIMLVDVGWMLNIQSRLVKFIRSLGIVPDIIGCYVGSREHINKSLSHFSLMFQYGDPSTFAQFFEANTTLFEVLFSAPEAPTQDLNLDPASGQPVVVFKPLSVPPSREYTVAQKLHMGAEGFFAALIKARKTFFPEQISRDYFYHIMKALVETDNPVTRTYLNQFELCLGGHHELVVKESLLPIHHCFEYQLKPKDEYFEPVSVKSLNNGPLLILVTSAGLDNGSTRYRTLHLAESLRHVGVSSLILHAATPEETIRAAVDKAQAIIFQRCFLQQGHVKTILECARAAGLTCLADMDDLVFPEYIKTIGSVTGGEWDLSEAMFVATSYKNFLLKLDGCIVSTPLLKTYIKEILGLPAVVIRNKIEPHRLRARHRRAQDPLRLLYASGTSSHKEDFALIESDLYAFLGAHLDVRLSVLGNAQVSGRILALPNVSNYPLLPYDAMLDFMAEHDLMLVPLVDNVFNQAKSAVKFVEAAAMGVAVLASPVNEFAHAIRHGQNGLLAAPTGWRMGLEFTLAHPETLMAMGQAAQETVAHGSLTSQSDPEAFRTLLDAILSGTWRGHAFAV